MNTRAAVRLGPAAAGRCRRRVHLDHFPQAPRAARSTPDAGVKMRLADAQAHTERVLDRLPAAATGWTPRSAKRPALVKAPLLRTPTRIGTPDLLIAGEGGYLPVIIRGHRTLDPAGPASSAADGVELSPIGDPFTVTVDATRRRRRHQLDLLQLAHHYAMLTELGLAGVAAWGGVIGRGGASGDTGPDDGELIVWHDLTAIAEEYALRFADRLAVAAAAEAGGELALPSRVAECRRCSWWPVCSVELEASHDISLLAAGSDVPLLHDAGLFTLDDLVDVSTKTLKQLPLTSIPPGELKVRARARLDGLPLVRRAESAAARRADVEMDVDMESYLDEGAYLWGTLLSGVDIGFGQQYRPFGTFVGLPGEQEAVTFVAFWNYLSQVRTACAAQDLSFAAYCWSRTAEERWMYSTPRRFPDTAGMPTPDDVGRFCTSTEWIDLYAEVKRQFVVPGSMRLKAIAPVAGFQWRDPEPGGENSMAWYRSAVGSGDADGPDLQMRQRILDYNEDDVRATAAIRRWMSDGAGSLPTIAQVLAGIERDAAQR